ncbi:hypothetical protein BC829DRAFT_275446 [Chytridium lagenaria]|nr:hypothetical protein BC829DRAFT_275446 [Chytridium lagenaria]
MEFGRMKAQLLEDVRAKKTILISIPNTMSEYSMQFHHPYQVIHATRRCDYSCAFLARDFKYSEPFAQYQFDHLWLENDDLSKLENAGHASLQAWQPYFSNVTELQPPKAPNGKISVSISLKPPKVTYHHHPNASYFFDNTTIPFTTGLICNNQLLRTSKPSSEKITCPTSPPHKGITAVSATFTSPSISRSACTPISLTLAPSSKKHK